jgi:hypothetical protein
MTIYELFYLVEQISFLETKQTTFLYNCEKNLLYRTRYRYPKNPTAMLFDTDRYPTYRRILVFFWNFIILYLSKYNQNQKIHVYFFIKFVKTLKTKSKSILND